MLTHFFHSFIFMILLASCVVHTFHVTLKHCWIGFLFVWHILFVVQDDKRVETKTENIG